MADNPQQSPKQTPQDMLQLARREFSHAEGWLQNFKREYGMDDVDLQEACSFLHSRLFNLEMIKYWENEIKRRSDNETK